MKNKIAVWLPTLLAISICLGMFLGMYFSQNNGGANNPIRFMMPSTGSATKLNSIVSYIDEYYVDSVQKEQLIQKAIEGILEELDPHSYYISEEELNAYTEPLEGKFEGIGVEFLIVRDTVVVVKTIPGGPSEKVGVQAGDRLVLVDLDTVAGIGINNQKVMSLLKGAKNTKVKVGVERMGSDSLLSFEITRASIPIHSVEASMLFNDSVGYMRITRFARNTFEEFEAAADSLSSLGIKELILDLRGNGGGYLEAAISISEELLPKGNLIVYTDGKSQNKREYFSEKDGKYLDLKLHVLVNEASASASEIVAGAIQDNDRGLIYGRRTFGKGLVQEHLNLPDQSALRLTVARYYTPTGRSIQKPYGKNINYSEDYEDRYLSGELFYEDSIKIVDSLKYTTKGGKTVYGGGGIVPDVFVSVDTTQYAGVLSRLLYTGALNRYAFDLMDANRKSYSEFKSPEAFATNFTLTDQELKGIFTEAYGYRPDLWLSLTENDRDFLSTRLRSLLGRNIFGAAGFYAITFPDDPVIKAALGK